MTKSDVDREDKPTCDQIENIEKILSEMPDENNQSNW